MSVTIGQNIGSLKVQRALSQNSEQLSAVNERLSSGMRINKASDDAAGLAIASSLNADARVYNQAVRNVSDGISLLNQADGALSELTGIVTRITELAEQSANGTYSNAQRQALDAEAQSLKSEYSRILAATKFNGLTLLDGSLGSLRIQAGYGDEGTLAVSLGENLASRFDFAGSYQAGVLTDQIGYKTLVGNGDFDGDGDIDLLAADIGSVQVLTNDGTGNFSLSPSSSDPTGITHRHLVDTNGDGILDIIGDGGNALQGSTIVRLGQGDGSFGAVTTYASGHMNQPSASAIGDFNNDGITDVAFADYSNNLIYYQAGDGSGGFGTAATIVGTGVLGLNFGDFNGDGFDDIVTSEDGTNTVGVYFSNGNGTFQAIQTLASGVLNNDFGALSGDFDGDGIDDIAVLGYGGDGGRLAFLKSNGDGTFQAPQTLHFGTTFAYQGTIGDYDGDGDLDFLATESDGTRYVLSNDGSGIFSTFLSIPKTVSTDPRGSMLVDVNGDDVLDIITSFYDGGGTDSRVEVLIANATESGGLRDFSLATRSDALAALNIMESALQSINSETSNLGAFQSRLDTARSNLQQSIAGFRAAEGRLIDADVAVEASNQVRLSILQQSAASVLAQANQSPALALRLLQGLG